MPPVETGTIRPVEPVQTGAANPTRLKDSDYVAYFNMYHQYKGVSAQPAVAQGTVIESSKEGWKLYGIAWYWWAIGVAVVATVVVTARKACLNRTHTNNHTA